MTDDQPIFAAAHAALADTHPDAPALEFPDQTLTHDQVRRLGLAFAERMRAAGIAPGKDQRVQLRTPDPTLVLAVLLATSWLGVDCVPFPGEGGTPAPLVPTHYLYDPRLRDAPAPGAIAIDADWSPALTPAFSAPGAPDPEAPWLWVHTTGTTGLPKFLSLSQRMVTGRSLAVGDEFRLGSRHVLLAHCYSRPFLARAAAALLNGATLCFDLAPQDWHKARIDMVSGSRALIRERLKGTVLSPRVARIELAGSKLPDHEAIALLDSFEVVDDTYGASETSKSYSTLWHRRPDGTPEAQGHRRDSVIEIVDEDGAPVPDGDSGIVRVRNPYMATGYLDAPEASAAAFRDGWFYPGDVARSGQGGRLHFDDRADHVVNILGNKVNAFQVDQLFRAVPGIRDAICFRNPKEGAADELFAFVDFEEGINRLQAIATAKTSIAERMGEDIVPRVVQPVPGIPRKPDGAPDRKACAEMVLKVAEERAKNTSDV